jgi:hypothetical protein
MYISLMRMATNRRQRYHKVTPYITVNRLSPGQVSSYGMLKCFSAKSMASLMQLNVSKSLARLEHMLCSGGTIFQDRLEDMFRH